MDFEQSCIYAVGGSQPSMTSQCDVCLLEEAQSFCVKCGALLCDACNVELLLRGAKNCCVCRSSCAEADFINGIKLNERCEVLRDGVRLVRCFHGEEGLQLINPLQTCAKLESAAAQWPKPYSTVAAALLDLWRPHDVPLQSPTSVIDCIRVLNRAIMAYIRGNFNREVHSRMILATRPVLEGHIRNMKPLSSNLQKIVDIMTVNISLFIKVRRTAVYRNGWFPAQGTRAEEFMWASSPVQYVFCETEEDLRDMVRTGLVTRIVGRRPPAALFEDVFLLNPSLSPFHEPVLDNCFITTTKEIKLEWHPVEIDICLVVSPEEELEDTIQAIVVVSSIIVPQLYRLLQPDGSMRGFIHVRGSTGRLIPEKGSFAVELDGKTCNMSSLYSAMTSFMQSNDDERHPSSFVRLAHGMPVQRGV